MQGINHASRRRGLWTLLFFLMISSSVDAQIKAQTVASIGTLQTTVDVVAEEAAPRLTELRSGTLARWRNKASEALIDSVELDGAKVPLHWKFAGSESRRTAQSVTFVYRCSSPRLRLTWEWKARAKSGPLEHTIDIENLDSTEIWIPLQQSFRFNFEVEPQESLQQLYVDKGMGRPSEIGTHQLPIAVGYQWEGRSSTYARDEDEREVIPWFMVERAGNSHDGWYVGIEFGGRTALALKRDTSSLQGSAGLNPDPGPFRSRLLPGESFEAPPILLGGFSGGRDGLGNVLRPWVRQVLNSPETWKDATYPRLVNNSWGSGMQVDESLALRMIHDSAELGLEMFHLDAGWFRGAGDWYASPTRFAHGLAPLADEAHRLGLKFGIWVDWAQGGVDTEPGAVNVRDPKRKDWLIADVPPEWKPDEFVGRTMDLGLPAVKDYAQVELERIVTDYHLDMLEHDGYVVAKNCSRTDHPHAAATPPQLSVVKGSGIALPDASNSTDVSYHAVRAYYNIYTSLRRQHPDLLFEICNDGGRMVDFGSASHGDYFSITDAYDPVSNRRAFYDASHILPAAMLEAYVEKWSPHVGEKNRMENFRYMLRSGMMGWLTVMQDTNAWTPQEHAAAKAEFALYKRELRPLIRDAALYHVSSRPDGVHWDGMEYFDPERGRGVLYAFRGSGQDEGRHTFLLQAIRHDRRYHLRFQDRSSSDRTVSGQDLSSSGLSVVLPVPQSSELIFIDEVPN